MELNTTQIYEIEQEIFKSRKIQAIKRYREATNLSLSDSKKAIEEITLQLMQDKPWMFNEKNTPKSTSSKIISKKALVIFILIDTLIFGGAIYWFMFYNQNESNKTPIIKTDKLTTKQSLPKIITQKESIKINQKTNASRYLAKKPNRNDYHADINPSDTFLSLYEAKLNDSSYQERKNNSRNSKTHDDSLSERKIKTLRSHLTAKRIKPVEEKMITIPVIKSSSHIDGKIEQSEWLESIALEIGGNKDTTIYLQSDGKWLYIACDARDEVTAFGYDQLRVYFHAGLIAEMVNERIHLGKSNKVTSIRQTNILWQGDPPQNKYERWKKYAINDWGLYKYAVGSSDLHGNRHYEVAIYLEEVGIHLDVPFTLSIEVETDPKKNDKGKFVKRQYLGYLGSIESPFWFRIGSSSAKNNN